MSGILSADALERILGSAPRASVGVLGDMFLDRYLEIDRSLDEPSVETGLTAYQVARVRSHPGAAGTVVANLASLGVGRIIPFAFAGDDGAAAEGYRFDRPLAAAALADEIAGQPWRGLFVAFDYGKTLAELRPLACAVRT